MHGVVRDACGVLKKSGNCHRKMDFLAVEVYPSASDQRRSRHAHAAHWELVEVTGNVESERQTFHLYLLQYQ